MADDIIVLPSDAPAPLAIYEQEKIHPDNLILLQQRLDRFRPLQRRERIRLERRRNKLWKLLNKGNWNLLCQKRFLLWEEFTGVRDRYHKLSDQLQTGSIESLEQKRQTAAELRSLKERGRRLADQGQLVIHQIADLQPVYDDYHEITRRLDEHEKMIREEKEEREKERKFRKEARIIEDLMRDTFRRTMGCHHLWYDSRGRRHCDVPYFQLSGSNADSHWFLVAASEKQRFGWRSVLPYSVDVEVLTSERVLQNLSIAVGMQAEARRSEDNNQLWYQINRLDSPNGLPAYYGFGAMFQLYPEGDHELVPFPVGVFENRRVRWFNLKSDPHILVAGKTRSGKSNFLNCIISTMIQTHTPSEVQLILIDNKGGVEFTHYKGVPHLLGDFVKLLDDVLPRLEQVRKIMSQRLALMEAVNKKDIFAYNRLVEPAKRLSHIIIFIDEMQTLLNRGPWTRDVHHLLAVIGSQGAAPGIHLVLCTQHPAKEVVPMPVKTNMSCFIALRMSQHASMTILASPAAADLPRKVPGRIIVASGMEMDEAQTPYISDEDIAEAVEYSIRQFNKPAPLMLTEDDDSDTEPLSTSKVTFTEDDLLALAIHNLEGNLKADVIFGMVKELRIASASQVRGMVREIRARERVEYDGQSYKPVKRPGNYYHLEPVESPQLNDLTDRQSDEQTLWRNLSVEPDVELVEVATAAD